MGAPILLANNHPSKLMPFGYLLKIWWFVSFLSSLILGLDREKLSIGYRYETYEKYLLSSTLDSVIKNR